jgi:hypothetical protein
LLEAQLAELKARSEREPDGPGLWLWHVAKGALKALAREDIAMRAASELGRRKHDFTGIRRIKTNHRERAGARFLYIASVEHGRVIVLMFGERRIGSPLDVYEQFEQHLAAGDFDESFAELGLPCRRAGDPSR